MRRKRTPRPIMRRITVTCGGETKTFKRRITLRQANVECPVTDSPFCTKGDTFKFSRRVLMVRLEFEYEAVEHLVPEHLVMSSRVDLNPAGTIANVRAGGERGAVL